MKKIYERPEVKIIEFEVESITANVSVSHDSDLVTCFSSEFDLFI